MKKPGLRIELYMTTGALLYRNAGTLRKLHADGAPGRALRRQSRILSRGEVAVGAIRQGCRPPRSSPRARPPHPAAEAWNDPAGLVSDSRT